MVIGHVARWWLLAVSITTAVAEQPAVRFIDVGNNDRLDVFLVENLSLESKKKTIDQESSNIVTKEASKVDRMFQDIMANGYSILKKLTDLELKIDHIGQVLYGNYVESKTKAKSDYMDSFQEKSFGTIDEYIKKLQYPNYHGKEQSFDQKIRYLETKRKACRILKENFEGVLYKGGLSNLLTTLTYIVNAGHYLQNKERHSKEMNQIS